MKSAFTIQKYQLESHNSLYKIICQVNLENLVFNQSEQISLLNNLSEIALC